MSDVERTTIQTEEQMFYVAIHETIKFGGQLVLTDCI